LRQIPRSGSFLGKALAEAPGYARESSQNPFIDPWGYRAYIIRTEAAFQAELQREHPG
jgi:hypothetical protein